MSEQDFNLLKNPPKLAEALAELEFAPSEIESHASAMLRLGEWQAPPPTPAATQQLIARLAPKLANNSPVRQALNQQRQHPPNSLTHLLEISRLQVSILRPSFWLLSALVTLAGLVAMLAAATNQNQAMLLRATGPLLAYLGAVSVFRGLSHNVLELEMSCPPTLFQLTSARLLIVLGYDTGLGLLLSGLLGLETNESFLALTLHWLTPLLLVTGVGLFLSLRLAPSLALSLTYGGWLAILSTVWAAQQLGLPTLTFSLAVEIATGVIGLVFILLSLGQIRFATAHLLWRN